MPAQHYIDVRIVADGRPLQEYINSTERKPEAYTERRYMEAKTGLKFAVQVTLRAGFDFRFARFVKFTVNFDGSNRFRICKKNDGTGDWHHRYFTFGAFGTVEDTAGGNISIDAARLGQLGSIHVEVCRAYEKKLEHPIPRWNSEEPDIIDHVPEIMMKGKQLKNTVDFEAAGNNCNWPGMINVEYPPITGDAGLEYTFHFLYRSRRILQNLGMLPRSPSPPCDTSLQLERMEDTVPMSKQRERMANLEIIRLREQLARSTSANRPGSVAELNGHAPFPDTPRSMTQRAEKPIKEEQGFVKAKSEPMAIAIPMSVVQSIEERDTTASSHKRKREDDDPDDDDEIVELPKRVKVVEIVDLTEDD